jgi:hypothetical protein
MRLAGPNVCIIMAFLFTLICLLRYAQFPLGKLSIRLVPINQPCAGSGFRVYEGRKRDNV